MPLPPALPMVGLESIDERMRVDPESRGAPSLDGSVLERDGVVFAAPLSHVLDWCRRGAIVDAKTELGARRLGDVPPHEL